MHSWILRHRKRLRLIYGPARPASPESGTTAGEREQARPEAAPAAGTLRRVEEELELVPMPKRAV